MVVRLVPAAEPAEAELSALIKKLQVVTGNEVEVMIAMQSEIPSAPAGKSRACISLINEPEGKSDEKFT